MQRRLPIDKDIQIGLLALSENGPKAFKVVVINDANELLDECQLGSSGLLLGGGRLRVGERRVDAQLLGDAT